MTSQIMTSHCMTLCCSVLSLLELCEYDSFINIFNFKKLGFIVYEILENSQLFLTDYLFKHSAFDLCTTI